MGISSELAPEQDGWAVEMEMLRRCGVLGVLYSPNGSTEFSEAGSSRSWEASDARDRQFKNGQGVERHGAIGPPTGSISLLHQFSS